MLSSNFNRIGIASITVKWVQGSRTYELHYWVQEFGYRTDSFGLSQTDVIDGFASAPINVLQDNISSLEFNCESHELGMTVGESHDIDSISTTMSLTETWPSNYKASVVDNYTLTSADPSVVSVSGNTVTANNVGTTTVTATSALDSSMTAEIAVTVAPKSLSGATVEIPAGDYTYTGAAQAPVPSVVVDGTTLVADTDYSVSYADNVNAGDATVTVSGEGNYKDSASTTFEITRKGIDAGDVTVQELAAVTYTGAEQTPAIEIRYNGAVLANETDYTAAYSNNLNAGTASITVTGNGNYSGERTVEFTIDPASINDAMVSMSSESLEYTGQAQAPVITVTANPEASGDDAVVLEQNKDYTVATDENAIGCGDYQVSVTGMANYRGTVTKPYAIVAKPLDAGMIQLDVDSKTYNGQNQAPAVTVKNGEIDLTAADCTVTNNGGVDVGTYAVEIVAVAGGNYKIMKDDDGNTRRDKEGHVIRGYSFTDTNLTADTKYQYRMKVRTAKLPGESIFSPIIMRLSSAGLCGTQSSGS